MNARKRAEELDEQLERDLGAWIGAQRSEPGAFRAGVERRIAEAERARQEREQQDERGGDAARVQGAQVEASASGSPRRSEMAGDSSAPNAVEPPRWVRKAATWLPPDFGAVLLASGKGGGAALLLPVLVFGAAFGVFFAGLRSIDRSVREAAPAPERTPSRSAPRYASSSAERPLKFRQLVTSAISCLAYVAFLVFGGSFAVDIAVACVAVAMAAFAIQVRKLSSTGLLERGLVVDLCFGVLSQLGVAAFFYVRSPNASEPGATFGILAASLTVYAFMGALGVWRRRSMRAWLSLAALSALTVPASLALALVIRTPQPRAENLREFIRSELDVERGQSMWLLVAEACDALRDSGESVPDTAVLRDEIERALAANPEARPELWTAAAALGAVSQEQWNEVASRVWVRYQLDELLELSGPLELRDRNEYLLHMLIATRELSGAQRAHLAERIERSWPTLQTEFALERALACVRRLDLLGEGARVEARREALHELLVRHWERYSSLGRPGGFAAVPDRRTFPSVDATFAAVALMARVGVPAGVDRLKLADYLQRETRTGFRWYRGPWMSQDTLLDLAALRLERQIGLPELSWVQRLIAERVLLAVALILALCVYAIRSAPERDPFALAAGAPG